jgi:iron(III) transport system ATP-binding protein
MNDLVIVGLTKTYGAMRAVDDVSLLVKGGTFVSFLGPSGCGKTTTLNSIAGLEQPDAGRITAGDLVLMDIAKGVSLPPERRKLGMVFQNYALWPHMTVYNNLAFGLKLNKVPAAEIRRRITDILDLVGLADFEKRYPFQLSGGQQQRVALARAVVSEPQVLLLDEPLSNLDAKVREQARFWLREVQQRLSITTVYVTHDQAEALAISDMVAVMAAGHVLQYAPPREVYERPVSRFVADFIGATSFLPGTVRGTENGHTLVRLTSGQMMRVETTQAWADGARVVLAARSERIGIARGDGDNVLSATIRSHVYLGASYQYLVDTPDGSLKVETPRELPNGELRLSLPPDGIVLLADDGERMSGASQTNDMG